MRSPSRTSGEHPALCYQQSRGALRMYIPHYTTYLLILASTIYPINAARYAIVPDSVKPIGKFAPATVNVTMRSFGTSNSSTAVVSVSRNDVPAAAIFSAVPKNVGDVGTVSPFTPRYASKPMLSSAPAPPAEDRTFEYPARYLPFAGSLQILIVLPISAAATRAGTVNRDAHNAANWRLAGAFFVALGPAGRRSLWTVMMAIGVPF